MIGLMIVRFSVLRRRIDELESTVQALKSERTPQPEPEPAPEQAPETEQSLWATPETGRPWAKFEPEDTIAETGSELSPEEDIEEQPDSTPIQPEPAWHDARQVNPLPSLLEKGLKKARDWITSGNVPVKVGLIVTFIGV